MSNPRSEIIRVVPIGGMKHYALAGTNANARKMVLDALVGDVRPATPEEIFAAGRSGVAILGLDESEQATASDPEALPE